MVQCNERESHLSDRDKTEELKEKSAKKGKEEEGRKRNLCITAGER